MPSLPRALMLSFCSAFMFPELAHSEAKGVVANADISLTAHVLEHRVEGGFAENLVRLTAVNHGPADVSSYLVSTCLADLLPIEVDGGIAGGCGEFGLVAPCTEFGLGFQFGALGSGQIFQCLVRVRSPIEWTALGMPLSASHLRDADGNGVFDPNEMNDSIVLSAGGLPDFMPVPALSIAGLLVLVGLLMSLVCRHLPVCNRGR
jgi:hypothetical protein